MSFYSVDFRRRPTEKQRPATSMYCFSPPVMIATFLVESGMALWVLWRYRHTALVRLIAVILLCLAVFQLAEATICEGWLGLSKLTWARLGYVAITALPALGIHVLMLLARQRSRLFLTVIYGVMVLFMMYFLFVSHGITAATCGGNYVLFETNPRATLWYSMYYYGLETIAVGASLWFARKAKTPKQRQALYGLTVGYLVFIVPVITANLINPKLIHAIPSIMCGFAVLLALTLTLYVLPRSAKVRL